MRLPCSMHNLRLAQGVGRDLDAFMPVTAPGNQLFAGFCNSGRDGLHSAAVGLLFQELSGIKRGA